MIRPSRQLRRLVFPMLFTALATSASNGQAIDTAMTFAALREVRVACTADGGRLWGRTLCGPVVLVDRGTRLGIANDTVAGRAYLTTTDAYVTTVPSATPLANTSFDWGGRSWAMITLPLPADAFTRVTLLMHEIFHREQRALNLEGSDPANNQLDQRAGRRWFRLELNAYAEALRAVEHNRSDAQRHVMAALLFRARRYALYPLADSLEKALELQEGLAEYTGEHLALQTTGADLTRVAQRLVDFQQNPTLVRSFAYATGPAIGLLLDHLRPSWQAEMLATRNLAELLRTAVGYKTPRSLAADAERAAASYGVADIDREEAQRDSARAPAMARYQQQLVAGPTLTLVQRSLGRSFNPMNLVGFDMTHTVYPTGTFMAEWGTLEVADGGALLANDMSTLVVAAPDTVRMSERPLKGAGWTLTLKPAWQVVPDRNRPGSVHVEKLAP